MLNGFYTFTRRSPGSLGLRKSRNILVNLLESAGATAPDRRGYLLEAGSPAERRTARLSSATMHSDACFSAPSLRSSYMGRTVMTLTLIQRASMWTPGPQ